MKAIKSTDYYQKDDYIEAENAYSVVVGSIQEQIELFWANSRALNP